MEAKKILLHAVPVLIAQLASIGLMMVDTVILGRVSSVDLAAISVGATIAVSLIVAFTGVIQALTPLVARAYGAGDYLRIRQLLQQSIYLSLFLALGGIILLANADYFLRYFKISQQVLDKTHKYLLILSFGLPALILYRAFVAFCNGVARPKVLIFIGITAAIFHAIVASNLAFYQYQGEALGVVGCAISYVLVVYLECLAALIYLYKSEISLIFKPLSNFARPNLLIIRQILRLGAPIGFSMFVEVTSFTLISLLLLPFGEKVVAAHRVVASLATLVYMFPLSIAIATLAAVGYSLGQQNHLAAIARIIAGTFCSCVIAVLVGLTIWFFDQTVLQMITTQVEVISISLTIMACLAAYQFFDALQTIIAYVLRAYHVTLLPMAIQIVSFWGIGLLGGWYLSQHGSSYFVGILGFWWSVTASLFLASLLLSALLFILLSDRYKQSKSVTILLR